MYDISIIIINFNTEQFTINCIASFLKHTSSTLNCQYIVVDNASEKNSYEAVKTYIKSIQSSVKIKLIRSNINTGFGGGNMIGVENAKSKYYAFVNNDVIIENDCLSVLKNFMDSNENVGVCGPQAFTEHGNILPTIDHFASLTREVFGRTILEKTNPKKYPKRKQLYTKPTQSQFIAGSFMFFNANDFKTVGGFDENIFLYYEETDICKRLQNINKDAFLVPDAKFIHFHGASTKKSIAIKTELKISLLYVIKKHYGKMAYYTLLTHLQIRYFFSSIFKPKYWKLFFVLLKGAPLSLSLKHKQTIKHL